MMEDTPHPLPDNTPSALREDPRAGDHRPVGRPRRRVSGGLLVGLAAAAVLIALGAVPRLHQHAALEADALAAVTDAPLVDVVHPQNAPASTSVSLPGSIQAFDTTTVNARTTGYVRRYLVDIGARVHQDQVLAEIESPEVDQQLLGAEAEAQRSAATVGQTQADVVGMTAQQAQAAAQKGASVAAVAQARADVIRYQARALQAQAGVASARSRWAEAQKTLIARKADVVRNQAAVVLAGKTLKRWQQLGSVNAVAIQEVDEKQADYDGANAALAAAQAAVEEAAADVQATQSDVESRKQDALAAAADVEAARGRVTAARENVASGQAGVAAAAAAVSADEQNVNAARSSLRASQATARRYAVQKQFQSVVAPFDGVITARNVDIGSLVGGSGSDSRPDADPNRTVTRTGLFGIARTDTLRILVDVPQTFVPYLHRGETANVTLEEFPGRTFYGKVYMMSGAIDSASRTMEVQVLVPNPTGRLIPGMYAEVQLVGQRSNPPLIVPASALIFDAAGERVAIVKPDNHLHFQPVVIARDLGSSAEIGSGLTTADALVSNPSDDLMEGETVRIAPPTDQTTEKPRGAKGKVR